MSNERQPHGSYDADADGTYGGQQPHPHQGDEYGRDEYGRDEQQHQQQHPGQQPPAAPQGWGGGYDVDTTGAMQVPIGGWPPVGRYDPADPAGQYGQPGPLGAPGTAEVQGVGGPFPGESPLAAPGTGQGGYTPPVMDPGTGSPMTPEATTDPSATGEWTLPFAVREPGASDGLGAPGDSGQDTLGGQDLPGGQDALDMPGGASAALGQGAAAALAGSHEARTQRRPLGTGGAAEQPEDGPAPGMPGGPGAQSGSAWQSEGAGGAADHAAQLADALARRQVPFTGTGPGAGTGAGPGAAPGDARWPDPGTGDPGHSPLPGEFPGGAPGELPAETPGTYGAGVPGPGTGPAAGPAAGPGALPGEQPHGAPADEIPDSDPGQRLGLRLAGADAAQESGPSGGGSPLPDAQPSGHGDATDGWAEPPGSAPSWDGGPEGHARPDDTGEYRLPAPPPGVNGMGVPVADSEPVRAGHGTAEEPDAPGAVEGAETADVPEPPEGSGVSEPTYLSDVSTDPGSPDAAGLAVDSPDGALDTAADGSAPFQRPTVSEHPHTSYVLHVNGADRPVTDAWIGESLLYVLRERLGLAGAKDGCSQGECGACSVQVDGRLVASCLVPAATAAGSEVRTVEGLATDGMPSDVQRALTECGAVQCGFCVPGLAMAVHDLLEGNHAPTELETRQAICGNLCRCSGYRGVLDAVRTVVGERAARSGADDEAEQPAVNGPPASASSANGSPADAARIPHQAPPGAGGVNPHPGQQGHQGGGA